MSEPTNSGSGLGKFIGGLLLGAILTGGYVRYAFELPEILTVGDKLAEATIVTTAEVDLYDLNNSLEIRERAMSVVLGQQPEKLIEMNQQFDGLLIDELYRRKATRKAMLLKQTFDAYNKAFEQPALVKTLETKYGRSDPEELRRRMLWERLSEDDFLLAYLTSTHPDNSRDETLDRVLTVYQHRFNDTVKIGDSDRIDQHGRVGLGGDDTIAR